MRRSIARGISAASRLHCRCMATSLQLATIEEHVQQKLQALQHPIFKVDLKTTKSVKRVSCSSAAGKVNVEAAIEVFSPAADYASVLMQQCDATVRDATQEACKQIGIVEPIGDVKLVSQPTVHSRSVMAGAGKGVANVGSVIAVSSGKGGVGKSTVAVNLAYALAERGARVGLLDADLHGPSLPVMVRPASLDIRKDSNGMINAVEHNNVKLMSYGWVAPKNKHGERTGAVMRGPLVSSLLQQLIKFTDWGHLDHLVIDLPPGTSDIHITLGQTLPISTAVIVTTPQTLALVDVVKGLDLFSSLKVPTSALVVNMAHFTAPDTGKTYYPFGDPAVQVDKILSRFAIPRKFMLPMQGAVSTAGDSGNPFVVSNKDGEIHSTFVELAGVVATEAEKSVRLADGIVAGTHAGSNKSQIMHATASFDDKKSDIVVRLFRVDGAAEHRLKPYETRLACKCAACIDEATGERLLDPSKVQKSVHPTAMQPQGNYGCAIQWSDGHSSGIYTYEQLEELARALP